MLWNPGDAHQFVAPERRPPHAIYRSSSGLGARQAAIELPCDVALERADDLAFGAAFPRAALDVGAGAGIGDHADHDDPPEGLIGGSVLTAVESFAAGQPRGGVDGGDATVMGERSLAAQALRPRNASRRSSGPLTSRARIWLRALGSLPRFSGRLV